MDFLGKHKKNMYRFQTKLSDMQTQVMIENERIRHNYNLKHFEILLDLWKENRKTIEKHRKED